MRTVVTVAAAILVAAAVIGSADINSGSVLAQSEVARTRDGARKDLADCGTLDCFAKRAKEKGQKEVYVPTPLEAPPAVGGWDDALARFTVVVAELVEKKSYVESPRNLVTWHKFKVVEYLSRADP